MSDPTSPAPGRFVWYDLMTTDPARATAFYTELFGWTTRTVNMGDHGDYTMIANNGKDFGGIVGFEKADLPSHWIHYTTVDDVDATVATVKGLGGAVHVPAMDIPTVGRFAVIADPTGGFISPFKSEHETPEDESPSPAGAFVWPELMTKDPDAAAKFLTAIFGWTARKETMGTTPYTVLSRAGEDTAGLAQSPPDSPTFWLSYVKVDDADAMASRAKALGATMMVEPFDMPTIGRIAIAQDPTGAPFGLFAFEG